MSGIVYSLLVKPASGNCNMRCRYCFYADEQENRSVGQYGIMTEETLKSMLRRFLRQLSGGLNLAFQGGEPTLAGLDFFENVVRLIPVYNKFGVPVQLSLQTNGYALDEKWCRFFKKHDFLIGVSVDGLQMIHDKYRVDCQGKATFEKVLRNMELLEEYQVPYNILTVVNHETAQHGKEIYEFYKEKGWEYQQFIPCLDPMKETPGGREWSLAPADYGKFLREMFHAWYKDVKNGKKVYNRTFENYIGILLGMPPEACDQRGTCGIQYVIEADGSVYPCDFYAVDEYRLGNVAEHSVAQVDGRRNEIGFLERSYLLPDECRRCTYFNICRGGCMRHRIKQEDGSWRNYFCESYRYFFDHCLGKMVNLSKEI